MARVVFRNAAREPRNREAGLHGPVLHFRREQCNVIRIIELAGGKTKIQGFPSGDGWTRVAKPVTWPFR